MDTVISFTPSELFKFVVAVCTFITGFAVALSWIAKAVHKIKAPGTEQNKRIEALEKTSENHQRFLANDKERLDNVEKVNKLLLRANMALLRHGIDNNNIDGMKQANKDIMDYLTDGKFSE